MADYDAGPRTLTVEAAMARALELAARGPRPGPNPRVGCVLLGPPSRSDVTDADDDVARPVLAEGFHRGAGTAHAEADALADARSRGIDVTGSTAVVTLEPCAHTGRTGPCAEALAGAGVAEVVYAIDDPNPVARGGGEYLRSRGVRVRSGVQSAAARELLRAWSTAIRRGTPYVTLKLATTLDGRVAAADGTSRWITGPQARAHAHAVRAEVDAIAVGTGTVLADDPSLTARLVGPHDDMERLAPDQPLRVVVGLRDVPASARVRGPGDWVHVRSRDVGRVLGELGARGVRHVLVEGGPGLATAFLAAGAVDEVQAYVAPVVLGAGRSAVGDVGVGSIGGALRFRTVEVVRLGEDVVMVSRVSGDLVEVSDGEGREC